MGTSDFTAGLTLRWTGIAFKESKTILGASYYRNRDKFRPDGSLGLYAGYTLQSLSPANSSSVVKCCVARRDSAVIITCPFRAMSPMKPAQYSSSWFSAMAHSKREELKPALFP